MSATGNKSLSIALLGMNDRDRARLELFLDQHWSSNCLLVSERYANVCILDLDGLDGKKLLQQQLELHSDRPLIVLSVRDVDNNDVTYLRKPVSAALLKKAINDQMIALSEQAAAEQFLEPAPEPTPIPAPAPAPVSYTPPRISPATTAAPNTANDRRSALPNTVAQARIIRGSCSVKAPKDFLSLPKDDSLHYDPKTLFQQALKSHIEQSRLDGRPRRLTLADEKYIVLIPETNVALTNLSDSKLRPRCLLPISEHQIRIDHPGVTEIQRMHSGMEAPQDIEYLLWKVTLWSARGRLPHGIHMDSVIELKQWPNLTRLLAIPQFLRIAALWAKNPYPLSKTVEALNIEARYVYAFFSACFALELAQVLSTDEGQNALQESQEKAAAPKGLLQRLLRRLRVA